MSFFIWITTFLLRFRPLSYTIFADDYTFPQYNYPLLLCSGSIRKVSENDFTGRRADRLYFSLTTGVIRTFQQGCSLHFLSKIPKKPPKWPFREKHSISLECSCFLILSHFLVRNHQEIIDYSVVFIVHWIPSDSVIFL